MKDNQVACVGIITVLKFPMATQCRKHTYTQRSSFHYFTSSTVQRHFDIADASNLTPLFNPKVVNPTFQSQSSRTRHDSNTLHFPKALLKPFLPLRIVCQLSFQLTCCVSKERTRPPYSVVIEQGCCCCASLNFFYTY